MKPLIILCASAFLAGLAMPAAAQIVRKPPPDTPLERAKKRCIEQHGVDCDKPDGLREWLDQERTMTPEQQRAAAAARRLRATQTQTR
jgi:hypothetical protein